MEQGLRKIVSTAAVLQHLRRLGYVDVFVDKELAKYLGKQGIFIANTKGTTPKINFSAAITVALSEGGNV